MEYIYIIIFVLCFLFTYFFYNNIDYQYCCSKPTHYMALIMPILIIFYLFSKKCYQFNLFFITIYLYLSCMWSFHFFYHFKKKNVIPEKKDNLGKM